LLAALVAPPLVTVDATPSGPLVDCRTGPAKRQFGRTEWNLFACNNGDLLVLAARGNPAFPAMINVSTKAGRAEVGAPGFVLAKVPAAISELRSLSSESIARLHAEATARHRKP
jgi:hypothetical protein